MSKEELDLIEFAFIIISVGLFIAGLCFGIYIGTHLNQNKEDGRTNKTRS
jgi:uncharacterized membrane protein YczE